MIRSYQQPHARALGCKQRKATYPIEEAHRILNLTVDFWKTLSINTYQQQLGLAKTYLWLSVTFLAFIMAMVSQYGVLAFSPVERVLFLVSLGALLVSLIIGIFSLSSMWLGKLYTMPHCEDYTLMIQRIDFYGVDSKPYFENLANIIGHFEASMDTYVKVISNRGYLLRAQSVILIVSVTLMLLGVVFMFF